MSVFRSGRIAWPAEVVDTLYALLTTAKLTLLKTRPDLRRCKSELLEMVAGGVRRAFPGRYANLTLARLEFRLRRLQETDSTRCWALFAPPPLSEPTPGGQELVSKVDRLTDTLDEFLRQFAGPADAALDVPINPVVAHPAPPASSADGPVAGFAQRYRGQKLLVLIGDNPEMASAKNKTLPVLGVQVRCESLTQSRGAPLTRLSPAIVEALQTTNLVYIYTRFISHVVCAAVAREVEALRASGREVTLARGRSLTPAGLARRFLAPA